MLRFALRRFYVTIIGLMMLTLPLFAVMRVPWHNKNICQVHDGDFCHSGMPMALTRNGPFYAVWQTGLPPNDFWPIAVALLTIEGATQFVLVRRHTSPI